MAIKSSDPHKLEDRSFAGAQLERVVEDAWATRHDSDNAVPSPYAGHEPGERGGTPETYRATGSTHHPFSDLRQRLRRH